MSHEAQVDRFSDKLAAQSPVDADFRLQKKAAQVREISALSDRGDKVADDQP
jgi:hypothetical protein